MANEGKCAFAIIYHYGFLSMNDHLKGFSRSHLTRLFPLHEHDNEGVCGDRYTGDCFFPTFLKSLALATTSELFYDALMA
jgi:hypothetical protein